MTQSTRSSSRPRVNEPVRAWSFEAIGTAWWIALYAVPRGLDLDVLYARLQRRVQKFDEMYSRFREDSLVSTWAKKPGTYDLPADALPLLDFYKQLYDLTQGAVTPLIGQALSDAGYDASYSLEQHARLAPPPAWDEALRYGAGTIQFQQPVLLDFGAAGKGYLVDILCDLLESEGVAGYCVDAGGDIRFRAAAGSEPLLVGLEHPDDVSQAIGVARLQSGAICGSAGNRRKWSTYHHIIDPHNLQSPDHLKAVWVTAETAMLADGLTTALYFAGSAQLREQFDFGYAIVNSEGSLQASGDFPAQFFTE